MGDWTPQSAPPTEAIANANAKAAEHDWWRLVSFQHDQHCYYVPSRTTPGQYYVVRRRKRNPPKGAYWVAYSCTCKAETSGRYVLCWHKAAVYMHCRMIWARPGYDPRNGLDRSERVQDEPGVLLPFPTALTGREVFVSDPPGRFDGTDLGDTKGEWIP